MGEYSNLSDTPKHISAEATSTPTGTTEINTMIFRETLLKYLGSKKEKNKEKLKWFGTLIDLRDFVTLILEEKGKWHTRTHAEHEIHVFEQEKRKFSMTWWQSSKTFVVQGEEKYSKKSDSRSKTC